MFYIITYATHSENYFELLKTYPNLIILGYGTKWTGFKNKADAVVSFCKKVKNDDIVCFVDGFDSIILESSCEILKRFKELNKDLIFSQDLKVDHSLSRYVQDRLFGNCNNEKVNSGLYIGKAHAIINVWKGLKENMDDQRFITQQCINGLDIYIDSTYYIFYNYSAYSKIDKITIKNNKLYINNNKFNTCIISAPGDGDIKFILEKLKYKNLHLIKKNKKRIYYTLKTYLSTFIPEIILLISLIFIFIFFGFNNLITYFIVFFLISIFLEIFIKTVFLNISNSQKILYTILDIISVFIVIFFIYITLILYLDIFKFNCNIKLFFFLNLYILILILLVFIFKGCILSILNNKIINNKNKDDLWKHPFNRIKYMFNKKENYIYKKNKNTNNTILWVNGNITTMMFIIILNIYFIIMIYSQKCTKI